VGRSKLRVVPSPSQRVDDDCIRLLTIMRRRALRGEIQSVAIATVTEGVAGGFSTAWSPPHSKAELAGSINFLNFRYLKEEIYEK